MPQNLFTIFFEHNGEKQALGVELTDDEEVNSERVDMLHKAIWMVMTAESEAAIYRRLMGPWVPNHAQS